MAEDLKIIEGNKTEIRGQPELAPPTPIAPKGKK